MRCKTLTAIYKNEINTLKKLYEIDFLIHKSVRIHIEQFTVRKIEIDFTSEQLVDDLIAVLTKVERLLMLFDGYFSRSKTVFSDAFKEYNDPYKFLQVLKGKDIPASEYYKYFVNITYEVFNQYGSPASGGERSEYNLLQELSDGVKNSILILDEPESSFDNIFLRDGVDSLLKDISKTIPVIIATHNNTIGVSVHPDYIVYACKEVLSDGKLEYHLYSGYPSSEDLVDLKGNHISRKSVLLDCLEAGEAAYMDRRNSYEILNG